MKKIFLKYIFSEDYKESNIVDSLQKPSEYENNIKNGLKIRLRPLITNAIVQIKRLKNT
jgi:hypothetical protein